MKKFTRFAPFGHGAHPGEPLGRRIYQASLEAIGYDKNFADENLLGELYANAMLAASARLMVEKAHAELHPLTTSQFLELHEQENGITPFRGTTKRYRRELLYALKRLNLNGRVSTIHQTLQEFLGDDFVGYRTVRTSELPAQAKAPNPAGNQSDWDTPMRVMRASVGVVHLNRDLRIPVEFVAGDSEAYSVGQSVVIDAGSFGRSEVITIAARTSATITATFKKPHDPGVFIVGGHHPRHWTTKRVHLVFLRNGKAIDPIVRGSVELLMRRLIKGTARWYVLDENDPFTSGPFLLGESYLGATSLGATSL
jgi:hypothetical protein